MRHKEYPEQAVEKPQSSVRVKKREEKSSRASCGKASKLCKSKKERREIVPSKLRKILKALEKQKIEKRNPPEQVEEKPQSSVRAKNREKKSLRASCGKASKLCKSKKERKEIPPSKLRKSLKAL